MTGSIVKQLVISAVHVCLLTATIICTGCSSSFTTGVTEPVIDLSGTYRSSSSVGSMGVLELRLERIELSSWFDALVGSDLSSEVESSEGFCTIGDHHVVINLDRGLLTDYYFEGMVIMDGTRVESLDGQFVFPDLEETLTVRFIRN